MCVCVCVCMCACMCIPVWMDTYHCEVSSVRKISLNLCPRIIGKGRFLLISGMPSQDAFILGPLFTVRKVNWEGGRKRGRKEEGVKQWR